MNGNTSRRSAVSAMCNLMLLDQVGIAVVALSLFVSAGLIAPASFASFPYSTGDGTTDSGTEVGYCEQLPSRICDTDPYTDPPRGCGGKTKYGPCVFESDYTDPVQLNGYSILKGSWGPSVVIDCSASEEVCRTLQAPTLSYEPALGRVCLSGVMAIWRADDPTLGGIYRIESNRNADDWTAVPAPAGARYGDHGQLGVCYYGVRESTEVEVDPFCVGSDPGECTRTLKSYVVNLNDATTPESDGGLGIPVSEVLRGVLIFDPELSLAANLGATDCNPYYDPNDPTWHFGLPCAVQVGIDSDAWNPSRESGFLEPFEGDPSPWGFDTSDGDVFKTVAKCVEAQADENSDALDVAGTPIGADGEAELCDAYGLVTKMCNDADPSRNGGNPSCLGGLGFVSAKAGDLTESTVVQRPNIVCVDEATPEALLLALTPYNDGRPVIVVACNSDNAVVLPESFDLNQIVWGPSDGDTTLSNLNVLAIGDSQAGDTDIVLEVPSRNDAIYDFREVGLPGVLRIVMNQLDDNVYTGDNSVYVDLGNGNDTAIGGLGSQTFYGGSNDDTMTGDADGDCVVLHDSQGKDIYTDFNPSEDWVVKTSSKSESTEYYSIDRTCRVSINGQNYIDFENVDSCSEIRIETSFSATPCPTGQ